MSTIAVTTTEVAWDSQVTLGTERGQYGEEKVQVHKTGIWGLVGDGPPMRAMIEWVLDGADRKKKPDGCWTIFRINSKGRMSVWTDNTPYEQPVTFPQTFGSGGQFAQGVLKAHAKGFVKHDNPAKLAVKIAAECDVYTGPPIKSLVIAKALERVKA